MTRLVRPLVLVAIVTLATVAPAAADAPPTHAQVWRAILRSRLPITPLEGDTCSETIPTHGGWRCETDIYGKELEGQCGGASSIRLRFVDGKIVPGSVTFSPAG